MEQVKALNALEPFLALTKSATSPRAAADLVTRVTSAPQTFVFTELLETPQIQNLASSAEFVPYLTLLQLFSYGTYADYVATSALPSLSDVQLLKIRQLSLLSLVRDAAIATTTTNNNNQTQWPQKGTKASVSALSYAKLIASLSLPTTRDLENLVISAVYAGLLRATLDPLRQSVLVNGVSPLRDLPPAQNAIPSLLASLREWAFRCDDALAALETEMNSVRTLADARATEQADAAARTEKLIEDFATRGENGAGNGNGSHLLHHDLNEGDVSSGFERALTGGGGGGGHILGSRLVGGGLLSSDRTSNSKATRGKRGSGQMDAGASGGGNGDEMDLDEEEEPDEKKRASRRKL